MGTNRLLTVREAADRIGVGFRAIQEAIRRERLRAQKYGHQYLIREADLDRYANSAERLRHDPRQTGRRRKRDRTADQDES